MGYRPMPERAIKEDNGASMLLASTLARCLFVTAVVMALAIVASLTYTVASTKIPFDMDEADHATAALELFTQLSRGDPYGIYRAIVDQAFYPPLHSVMVVGCYAVSGVTLASSRISSVICYGWYLLLLTALVHSTLLTLSIDIRHRPAAIFATSLTLLFAATSPAIIGNSVLCMLEPLGLFLMVVLLWCFTALDPKKIRSILQLATLALVSLLLTFSKYSFGLMVIPAVAAALLTDSLAWRERARSLVVYLAMVVSVLTLWLSVTDYYAASNFIIGHESSGPVLGSENLLYDIRAWFRDYIADRFVALALLPVIVLGMFCYRKLPLVRISSFVSLFGVGVVTLSTTNEVRHLMVVLPCLWILTGLGSFRILKWLTDRPQGRVLSGMVVAACFLTLAFSLGPPTLFNTRRVVRSFEGLQSFYDLQLFMARHVDPSKPILTFGFSDKNGEQLARWILAANGGRSYREIVLDSYPFTERHYDKARKRMRNIDAPWRLPERIPREPLSAVIAAGYYSYGVQMQNPKLPPYSSAAGREFRETMASYPGESYRIGDVTVVVTKLPTSQYPVAN